HGHFTVMISSPAAFLNFEKRFLRDVGCHVTVIASYPESGSRSYRFKSFYSHFLLELFVSVKINRITAGKRDDRFLKTGCASGDKPATCAARPTLSFTPHGIYSIDAYAVHFLNRILDLDLIAIQIHTKYLLI